MHTIGLDFETYSETDIGECGSYKYMEDPKWEPLLLSWAVDDEPVQLIDFTQGETISPELLDMLQSADYVKCAFNAAFEMQALREMGIPVFIYQWIDTMIMASYAGLPRSLKDVGKALRLPEDQQKMKEGKDLIRYFCVPCRPTKSNGGRTRNLPRHAPEKWEVFRQYNIQDVETERVIRHRLEAYPMPQVERDAWRMDQRINYRGIKIDREMAQNAIRMAEQERSTLTEEAVLLSGLDNPNSVAQLKDWLGIEEGQTLRKKDVAEMLKTAEGDQKRLLEIRQEIGKSSVKKYEAMIRSASRRDDRVRGTMAFYKANRTGRWAGQLIQPQNFPQNHLDDLDFARNLVINGDIEAIKLIFGSVNDTLSQLLRTALIPEEGNKFAVADFSAIEARVIAWLADEQWRIDTFAQGGDIYCASASQMFHCPVVKHGINGHLRQKGKIAELALGYGGSTGAMVSMGALDMGLKEEELPEIVKMWREASPNVCNLWYAVENAAMSALSHPGKEYPVKHGVAFMKRTDTNVLCCKLPSGRSLHYIRPHIGENRFGGDSITYEGNEAGKWGRVETFGGKMTENIIQALARDCLKECMLTVSQTYNIVFHVHDEMIVETDQPETALKDMLEIMSRPVPWAPGLLLKGDGYTCPYYIKD